MVHDPCACSDPHERSEQARPLHVPAARDPRSVAPLRATPRIRFLLAVAPVITFRNLGLSSRPARKPKHPPCAGATTQAVIGPIRGIRAGFGRRRYEDRQLRFEPTRRRNGSRQTRNTREGCGVAADGGPRMGECRDSHGKHPGSTLRNEHGRDCFDPSIVDRRRPWPRSKAHPLHRSTQRVECGDGSLRSRKSSGLRCCRGRLRARVHRADDSQEVVDVLR